MENKITLDDLKFIEDPKNRKAFLIALREVEEEVFEIVDAEESVKKMKELEKKQATKKPKSAEELSKIAIGSTPAERASSMISKRKFTNTNAVDLKEYKYWRDPNFDRKSEPVRSTSPLDSNPFPRPAFGESPRNVSKPENKEKPRKNLYDELFGEMVKDHEPKAKTMKTDTYKEMEKVVGDSDLLAPKSEEISMNSVTNSQTKVGNNQTTHVNKYKTRDYVTNAKKRVEQFYALQAEKKRKEEEEKREEARKKLQAEKVINEATLAEEMANDTDEKPARKRANKLTVEVIAPNDNVEDKPKKAKVVKKTTSSKPRKRKKKLDADIKLYRNIHID